VGVLKAARRLRPLALFGLALYVFVLVVSPVLHHDLACHVKTPGHCDACAASPVASRAESSTAVSAPPLDAGQMLDAAESRVPRLASRVSVDGRGPPETL
jgi:hypothetical protein